MKPHEIILRPLLSEKGMHFAEKNRQYAFQVAPTANKTQIGEAVETLFGVKVASVNTMRRHGKLVRRRTRVIRRADWKRAIVTLQEGYSIDVI